MRRLKSVRARDYHWIAGLSIVLAAFFILSVKVGADTVKNRVVSLSDNSKQSTNVSYQVNFTAMTDNTNAFIVDFCASSPAIVDSCDLPTGFDVTNNVGTSGSDIVSRQSTGTALVELSATANNGQDVSVELTGITNPSSDGTYYARIVTYSSAANATSYQSGSPGAHLDDGAAAFIISDSVGVGGGVPESIEFCTSGTSFDENGCAGTMTNPSVSLGDSGVLSQTLSKASIFSMISTNAASGAVISLKSDAVGCGGLLRLGALEACDIEPKTTAGSINDGAARFGMRLKAVNGGTGTITAAGGYSEADYFMDYVKGDKAGLTSPFGGPIYTTSGQPISDGLVELEFAANAASTTPAGRYFVTLDLTATGKF